MTTFDWIEPLDAPDGTCFFWTETTVAAFDEALEVTVYYEAASPKDAPSEEEPRLSGLGVLVEAAHEHLICILRDRPEALGLTRGTADLALENRSPGAFADATEIVLYCDGDTLVRFPYADLPGTERFGVGITVHRDGALELQDLRESVEVGRGSA
jgi:hypothetical protein